MLIKFCGLYLLLTNVKSLKNVEVNNLAPIGVSRKMPNDFHRRVHRHLPEKAIKCNAPSLLYELLLGLKDWSRETTMVDNPDFLSALPNDVIHAIFSFLPLKHAVQTSFLSTAWRRFWIPIYVNLDVDLDEAAGSHEGSKEVTGLIGTFLISCNGPRKLCLGLPKSEKVNLKGKNEWILMATKVEKKELHISFSEGNPPTRDNFHLILDINCPSLRNSFTYASRFASLKILHLRSITHLSKNMVAALFSNCQLLEALKLVKCIGLQHLDLKGGSHFESFEMLDCPQVVKVDLSAPNLKSFRYRGVLPCIQIKEASGLIDALLDFRGGPGLWEFDCEEIISLLKALKDIEILTLNGWLIEWMCSAGVIFGKLDFQFNKLKELWWIGSQMDGTKRDSLACFLNATPSLERLFIDIIDKQIASFPCKFFHHFWHEPHLWMDYATVKCNTLALQRLKTTIISGFTAQKEESLLIDLLHNKAKLLSLFIKSPQNDCCRRVAVGTNGQLQQSWTSKWSNFPVANGEREWFTEYLEEDCGDLRPAHSKVL